MEYKTGSNMYIVNSSPPSAGDTFHDPQWMPATVDSIKTLIYIVFFSYMYTCDKV